MKKCSVVFLFLALLSVLTTPALQAQETKVEKAESSKIVPADSEFERKVVGWSEKIRLEDGTLLLHAELDPTRQNSAVRVDEIEKFKAAEKKEKSSKKKIHHVRFTLRDRYGHEKTFERPIVRLQRIRTASGKTRTEYVVELGICLGDRYVEDEFVVSKAKISDFEVRLGRETLEGHFVIDPALTYTVLPSCPETEGEREKQSNESNK